MYNGKHRMSFPEGSVVKNLPASAGDVGLTPGLERSPGEGNGNSLQYSGIPWTEKPGRLQSRRVARVRHDLVTKQQDIGCSSSDPRASDHYRLRRGVIRTWEGVMGENPILFVAFYFSCSVVGTQVFVVYFLKLLSEHLYQEVLK